MCTVRRLVIEEGGECEKNTIWLTEGKVSTVILVIHVVDAFNVSV